MSDEAFDLPPLDGVCTAEEGSDRLDTLLTRLFPRYSRTRWRAYIEDGRVTLNGKVVEKTRIAIRIGDRIEFHLPPPEPVDLVPNDQIDLDILFEDADVVVINKPPDLVIHPARGHSQDTLVNALLFRCPDIQRIGDEIRPGIVHRLDKDTTGILVVAKHEAALKELQDQFRFHSVEKHYVALIWGQLRPAKGTISTQIGRHPTDRVKMSTETQWGRPAVTHYETLCTGDKASLVHVQIETGRTHQIRVHMAHRQCPVVGDQLYGRARTVEGAHGQPIRFKRQLLHAHTLKFKHPRTHRPLTFVAPPPHDFMEAMQLLLPFIPEFPDF